MKMCNSLNARKEKPPTLKRTNNFRSILVEFQVPSLPSAKIHYLDISGILYVSFCEGTLISASLVMIICHSVTGQSGFPSRSLEAAFAALRDKRNVIIFVIIFAQVLSLWITLIRRGHFRDASLRVRVIDSPITLVSGQETPWNPSFCTRSCRAIMVSGRSRWYYKTQVAFHENDSWNLEKLATE